LVSAALFFALQAEKDKTMINKMVNISMLVFFIVFFLISILYLGLWNGQEGIWEIAVLVLGNLYTALFLKLHHLTALMRASCFLMQKKLSP